MEVFSKDIKSSQILKVKQTKLLLHLLNLLHEQGIEDVGAVHDSIGVPAAYWRVLAESVRTVTASLFQVDVLGAVKAGIEQEFGVELPDTPAYGDLDVSRVLTSSHLFS